MVGSVQRASVPAAVGILVVAAAAGFVGGGVLGTLTVGGDDVNDAAAVSEEVAPEPVDLTVVEASCVREPAVDAAFNPVEYLAEFATDGDPESAWQCRGDGEGVTLELDLGSVVDVTAVGLIPGYAKVDPHDGTDWYPMNRRLTLVRWHFVDGTTVEQELDPDPEVRELQWLELPEPLSTNTLVLEIVSSVPGSSNAHPNVAISELEVRGATRATAAP